MLCITVDLCHTARPSLSPTVLLDKTRSKTQSKDTAMVTCLVESDGLAHGRLDVKGLDVLPVLLEERDKEVDT